MPNRRTLRDRRLAQVAAWPTQRRSQLTVSLQESRMSLLRWDSICPRLLRRHPFFRTASTNVCRTYSQLGMKLSIPLPRAISPPHPPSHPRQHILPRLLLPLLNRSRGHPRVNPKRRKQNPLPHHHRPLKPQGNRIITFRFLRLLDE